MAWFNVRIYGDLDAAYESLKGTSIVLREHVYAGFVDSGPPRLMILGAMVEADRPDAAEREVMALLPSDDYELDPLVLPVSSQRAETPPKDGPKRKNPA